ncbi:MAG: endonuclease/exonuclease/phosphatase family protein, partial [Deltaproteobacteria bacterium]|nr:endonuclease/exonuclease/phosphatase family protein [Deltaproteobacteria bacterium]
MLKKINRSIIILFVLLIFPFPLNAKNLTIASWNIRILSNNSRDDTELKKIASILKKYDLIAIQEARDTIVLDRLKDMCLDYQYVASEPVGRGVKEIYAFFYRKDLVEVIGEPAILEDPQDLFIREPFIGSFRADNFDFTLVTIHLLFGKNKADRRQELILLDEVLQVVQQGNGAEADVILLGDYNFGSNDIGWQVDTVGYTNLFTEKTTIGSKSAYDNIWINPANTKEYTGSKGIFKFDIDMFNGNLKAASLAVSDHRPIFAEFDTSMEDDDENDYGALSQAIFPCVTPEGLPSLLIGFQTTIKRYDQFRCIYEPIGEVKDNLFNLLWSRLEGLKDVDILTGMGFDSYSFIVQNNIKGHISGFVEDIPFASTLFVTTP